MESRARLDPSTLDRGNGFAACASVIDNVTNDPHTLPATASQWLACARPDVSLLRVRDGPLEFGRFSREFKRINGPCPSKQTFRSTKDGNVNEASVSLQAGNESLRLVATIAAYLAAIVGLCGRSPNCPRLTATYAFNCGYQKCPNSRVASSRHRTKRCPATALQNSTGPEGV